MKTLLYNAQVHTLDPAGTVAGAILYEDDRIVATGELDELRGLAGSGAERVDLDGASVLPGLIDTHPHLLHWAAMAAALLDIGDAVNHDEIVERIRERARATPAGQWIMTTPVGEPHYFGRRSFRDLEEGRLPDRHVLDRATTDHPVLIQAWGPRMPNSCAFNSAGLRAVHLSAHIPDRVCDVTLEKDWDGSLTGILHGPVNNYLSYDPFWGQIVTKIAQQLGAGADANFGTLPTDVLTRAMADANRRGITTVYECHAMTEQDIASYRDVRAAGEATLRVLTCLEPEAGADFYPLEPCSLELMEERMRRGVELRTVEDNWFRVDGLSLAPGGPCFSGHLWSHEPYLDPFGKPTYGTRFSTVENEAAFVRFCAENDVRLNMVAGTSREHEEFLGLAERHLDPRSPQGNRILQHAIMITAPQARRYHALGFRMTMSSSFTWGKGAMYRERLGAHTLRDLNPFRRLLDAGMTIGGGTDWGPASPWEHIRFAETHEMCETELRNDGPAQAIERAEAVAMWTRAAATVLDWPDLGTLEPGTLADLVVVDRDPLTATLDELPGTQVLRTVVGGGVVHDSGALGG